MQQAGGASPLIDQQNGPFVLQHSGPGWAKSQDTPTALGDIYSQSPRVQLPPGVTLPGKLLSFSHLLGKTSSLPQKMAFLPDMEQLKGRRSRSWSNRDHVRSPNYSHLQSANPLSSLHELLPLIGSVQCMHDFHTSWTLLLRTDVFAAVYSFPSPRL